MKTTITTAQAMSHPDVALTINTLGAMADELRAERDALQSAARLALTALNRAVPKNARQASEQTEAIEILKAVL